MDFRPILKVVFTKAISFLIFLIVLMCLKVVSPIINSSVFSAVVSFLEGNVLVIFMATLFLMLGELFDELDFPLTLPAPILNAIGSLFILTFIFNSLRLVSALTDNSFVLNLQAVYGFVYLCVFLVVLLAGYLDIIQNMPDGGLFRRSRYLERLAGKDVKDEGNSRKKEEKGRARAGSAKEKGKIRKRR